MVQSQTELLTTKEQAAELTCYQLKKSMSVMIVIAVLRRKWFTLKRDDPHKTDGAQEYFGYIYISKYSVQDTVTLSLEGRYISKIFLVCNIYNTQI